MWMDNIPTHADMSDLASPLRPLRKQRRNGTDVGLLARRSSIGRRLCEKPAGRPVKLNLCYGRASKAMSNVMGLPDLASQPRNLKACTNGQSEGFCSTSF